MITSAENYPKTPSQKKIMDRENPRTNGKSDAIQRKSHTVAYAYTLTKNTNKQAARTTLEKVFKGVLGEPRIK